MYRNIHQTNAKVKGKKRQRLRATKANGTADDWEHQSEAKRPLNSMSDFLQQNLLVLISYNGEHCQKIRREVSPDLFAGEYRNIAVQIYEHIDKYKKPPGDHLQDIFEKTLNNKRDRKAETRARFYRTILDEIHDNRDNVNVSFTMDSLNAFVRHQNVKRATLDVAEIVEGSHVGDEAIARCEGIYRDLLERNASTRPEPGVLASELEPEDTEWLWWPYIPAGELTLLGGRKGRGKGQLLASIAARIATGAKRGMIWPDKSDTAPRGHVLWIEAEDSLTKTVLPRLSANKAKLEQVTLMGAEEFPNLDMRRFIEKHDVRLVVLSPLMSFLPRLKNPNAELEVRHALERLRRAIDGSNCALIGIVHVNKKPDLDALERIIGSGAFTAFVRNVLLVEHDDEQEDRTRMVHAAHNLSRKGPDMLYEMEHIGSDERDQYVKVNWEKAEDDVQVSNLFDRKKSGKPSAGQWLLDYLREHGETERKEVVKTGIDAGYKEHALLQARKRRSKQIGFRKEDVFQGGSTWFLKN